MNKTQILSIEITTDCNLAGEHARCPNRSPERYRHVNTQRRLDDDIIVSVVTSMYREHGFRGLVAWHYYCEPLLEQERVLQLMKRIKADVPDARFLLWTNGTLLPEDPRDLEAFDRIIVTDYGNLDQAKVDSLLSTHPAASVHRWRLDGRLNTLGPSTTTPCGRMFTEMIIDAFGNLHACCYDWQGRVSLGSVFSRPLDALISNWQAVRDDVCGYEMSPAAPGVCQKCIHKHPAIAAILAPHVSAPEVVEAAKKYVEAIRKPAPPAPPPDKRKVAVVFVSYLKVPLQRLRDHFKWNDKIYRQSKARVYVVTEKKRKVPKYAECVVYPLAKLPKVEGKPRFSLCATKNAGIDKALEDGADVVLCVDVDHAFSRACWDAMVAVGDRESQVPVYRMSVVQGSSDGVMDHGCTGAIAMTAGNWKRVRWDERCMGYGADDGIMLADIKRRGLRLNRDAIIEHVEHPGAIAAKNVPGHGREGCYGRDGFNFDNFESNRRLHSRR